MKKLKESLKESQVRENIEVDDESDIKIEVSDDLVINDLKESKNPSEA